MSKSLSKRAEKLLARIKQGKFYKAYSDRNPAAMQELIEAKLVGMAGRVIVIEACFVPVTGYTPYTPERFEP